MRESFLQNLKAIEKGLLESKVYQLAQSGLDKGALAQVCTELFKVALSGAISLQELELKRDESALNLEKMRSDIELSILKAKAEIRNAEAEAVKSLIQGASMIRSVSDNAFINKTNAAVSLINTIGQATNTTDAFYKSAVTAARSYIEAIDGKPMTAFDDQLKKLIDKPSSEYGTKNIIIHAPKTLLSLGEFCEFKGISTYGDKKCRWTINDELVASNTKNYLFEAKERGEYKIAFIALNDDGDSEKDEVLVKVIDGELGKETHYLKKF